MHMASILFQIFIVSFLLNLVWEMIHSRLYENCLRMSSRKIIRLATKMSLKDGFWISFFYLITVLIFKNINILANYTQLLVFIGLALGFSFTDEKISIKRKRWQYSKKMPKVFKVGISPLFELAVTGILAFLYIFLI